MVCLDILQCLYYGQTGVFKKRDVDSCGFDIRGGVRQGCVLSPRLFSAVLEMALSSWRAKMEAEGLSLEDSLEPLLDLQFADDILVFCQHWTRRAFCWMSWLLRLQKKF